MPQRRIVLAGLAAAPFVPLADMCCGGHLVGSAFAQSGEISVQPDTLTSSMGDVVIQPINHATFTLSFGKEIVLFDPVGGAARYAKLKKPTAIMVTHAHPDHFDVPTLEALAGPDTPLVVPDVVYQGLSDRLKKQATVVANGGTGTIAGVPFNAIPMYNTTPDRLKYHVKGVGNGYVLSIGDKKVYAAGDTEDTPEIRALTGIDVAFLPMNIPYTQTGEQAAAAAKAFKPKVVYPYHYGKDGPEPAKFAAAMQGFDGVEVRQRDWYA
jgi:L-ascorbate metabolism protein UlaG (beta-lactamase superfamily)